MNSQSRPTAETGATLWVASLGLPSSGQTAEVARLRRLGFVAGIADDLVVPGNPNRFGLRLVEQLTSAASAKAELAHEAAN